MSGAAARDDAGETRSSPDRLSRFLRITAALLAVLLVVFGLSLLVNSQAIVGSTHQRNAHSLEVMASALEEWPRTAQNIWRARGAVAFEHDEIGPVSVTKQDCGASGPASAPAQRFFPAGMKPGEGPRYQIVGKIDGQAECFQAEVQLERLIGLSRSASRFSHVLVVAPDQEVIEQFGATRLPVSDLPPLSPVSGFARSVVASIAGEKGSADAVSASLNASPGAARLRIADTDYYAYVRPFQIFVRSGRPCPGALSDPAEVKPPPPPPATGGRERTPATRRKRQCPAMPPPSHPPQKRRHPIAAANSMPSA